MRNSCFNALKEFNSLNKALAFICAILGLSTLSCHFSNEKLFSDVTEVSGVQFSNIIKETPQQNIMNYEYEYNGGGVAVGDVNGDGLPDIYFTGNQSGNKLYLNQGQLRFVDVTEKAGTGGKASWATGVTMADVNGDGLLDIYVCYSGNSELDSRANLLYINKGIKDGIPFFKNEAEQYGLDARGTHSTQAVFFDYDRDGDLDMFLLNHATTFYSSLFNTTQLRTTRDPYCSNRLYRNDNGHFTDVSKKAGIKGGGNNLGLGVCVSDINNDGWPDMYTTNDYDEQDFLYLNNQNGTFSDATKRSLKHLSKNGMGCDIADYNNDGLMDIMVVDMLPEYNRRQKSLKGPDEYDKYQLLVDSGYFHQNMRNTLQLNQGKNAATGDPLFSEIAQLAGVSATDWSWAPLFADFDNDGNKDLFVSNGFLHDFTDLDFSTYTLAAYRKKYGPVIPVDKLIKELPSIKLSNYIFKNNGDLTFKNAKEEWGLTEPTIANGAVYVDLDGDGDLDLITNNLNEPSRIYENNSEKKIGNNYLTVALKGANKNTSAICARVTVITEDGQKQVAEVMPVRGFQSSVEPLVHFGLAKATRIKTLLIRWPDGKFSSLNHVKGNQRLKLNEDELNATASSVDCGQDVPVQMLTDYTQQSGIHFIQKENDFVDFKREVLLPWELSRQGPRLAKADVNGDGLEDVFIGAPMGQSAQLYLQTVKGDFRLAESQPWQADSDCEDVQSTFFDADGDGDLDLYVVSGGNEHHLYATSTQDRLYLNDGRGHFSRAIGALPRMTSRNSCVVCADYDKDGKSEIFVGGRVLPGNYGICPQSHLLKNVSKNGKTKFMDITLAHGGDLRDMGMVTDACWTDINKDGWPDLIVVGEWMSVKIFINKHGCLEDKSKEYGLDHTEGLWTRIFPCDIDGDGNTDFLLGNLAPNTQLKASVKEPMTLCVNDFFGTGRHVPLLCFYVRGKSYPYSSLDELTETMPVLKKKFIKYASYENATLSTIFTKDQLKGALELKATILKNSLLKNNGKGKFELEALPVRGQFSALMGAVKGDFDKDGKEDILCAGNFYPFRTQLGREDAGTGFLLKNNVKKKMIALGIGKVFIDGDVRDMLSVKNLKGKPLIFVSKNDAPIQVLKPAL